MKSKTQHARETAERMVDNHNQRVTEDKMAHVHHIAFEYPKATLEIVQNNEKVIFTGRSYYDVISALGKWINYHQRLLRKV